MENQENSSTPPTQSNSDIPWQILLQSEYAIREGDEFLGAINANNFEGRHTHNYEGMAVSVPPLPSKYYLQVIRLVSSDPLSRWCWT